MYIFTGGEEKDRNTQGQLEEQQDVLGVRRLALPKHEIIVNKRIICKLVITTLDYNYLKSGIALYGSTAL